MSINISHTDDTYTGGEHYWIRYFNGTHEVRRATPEYMQDNETVFRGGYDACRDWLNNEITQNVEYDHDL